MPLHVSSNKCSSSGGPSCITTSSGITYSGGWVSSGPVRSEHPATSVLYQMMYWYNLVLLMMSTCCSKHVEAWNKHIEKECIKLVINQHKLMHLLSLSTLIYDILWCRGWLQTDRRNMQTCKAEKTCTTTNTSNLTHQSVETNWNVMAHAQKPDFVFRRNGRVHLNRRGRQFNRLLAAEVCASALIVGSNAGYTVFRGSVKSSGYPLHSPVSPSVPQPLRHRVPSHFNWSLSVSK